MLRQRLAFGGLPLGALEEALTRAQSAGWTQAFRAVAAELAWLARAAQSEGRSRSAIQYWRWAATALHGASLSLHFEASGEGARLRRLAAIAYARALRLDGSLGRAVAIEGDGLRIRGYLRTPSGAASGVVVLLNGLDSVCEVELHAFGGAFVERGLAVLAVDVPGDYASRPRAPLLAVERVAPALAARVRAELGALPLMAFGVSFGGFLAARMLCGDPPAVAAVAVSPSAFFSAAHAALPRIRRMLRLSFGVEDGEIDALCARLALETLPPPRGALLVLAMQHDQLFGAEHLQAFRRWAASIPLQVREWPAEHVGTSIVHKWLPAAADWLCERAADREGRA